MKPLFCEDCGSPLNEHGSCTNASCTKFKDNATYTNPQNKILDAFFSSCRQVTHTEKCKLIVPDSVNADTDEIPIKQYDVARLQSLGKGARADGYLQVTNKRLLFRAAGHSIIGPTSLEYEFSLENIAGIEIRKEARFNFFASCLLIICSYVISIFLGNAFAAAHSSNLVSSVITALVGILAALLVFLLRNNLFIRYIFMSVCLAALPLDGFWSNITLGAYNSTQMTFGGVVLVAYGISLLSLAFAPNLVIRILTSGGTPSVEIRRKDGFFSFHHNEYTGFAQVMPGPDTDVAIKELGALIREIQQTGEYSR